MEDTKRIKITGQAIPVRGNDIDTDRIVPARFLRCVTFEDLAGHAFEDDRKAMKESGKTHAFDDDRFQNAKILFVNKNFGCGSSREHAPQALMRWNKGIAGIVGESFAEIFLGNCVSLGVPCATAGEETIQKLMDLAEQKPETEFTLNVDKKIIEFDGESLPVDIPDGTRQQFLEGRWDTTAEMLEAKEQIEKTAQQLPYFNHWK